MCGLFWGAHKSLAPRARTLLGGLGQATLSFFAVATLLFVFFGECPKFCDLAKQRRKIVGGVSEVGKDDFSLYFFWRCVVFLVFYFSSAALARPCLTWLGFYRICIAHGMFGKEIHECTPIFMGHVDMSGEGISMRPIGDPSGGIVRKWFQSFVY